MPANATPALVKTASGRVVKSYPVPAGWWVDARPAEQRAPERLRSLARRLGWIPNEFPTLPEFRANPRLRRIVVRKMLSDDAIKAGVLEKVFGVSQLTLKSQPRNKAKAIDVQAADYTRHVIADCLPYGTPGLIESLALPAIGEDHCLCEPIWPAPGVLEVDEPWRGKRPLANVKSRHPDTYGLDVNRHGEIVGVRYTTDAGEQVVDDPGTFVIFEYVKLYDSPLAGYVDLEAAYNAFLRKVDLVRLRAIFEDRAAGGFIAAKVANPADPNLHADLAAARSCGFIALQYGGSDIEVLNVAAGAHDVFRNSIEDQNKAMLTAIAGAYLHVIESQKGDPRGDSRVAASGSELRQWHLASRLSACLTRQLAPLIVRENFAGAGVPTLTLSAPNPGFIAAELENMLMMKQLVGAHNMSLEECYERGGFSPPRGDKDQLGPELEPPVPGVPGPGGGPPLPGDVAPKGGVGNGKPVPDQPKGK